MRTFSAISLVIIMTMAGCKSSNQSKKFAEYINPIVIRHDRAYNIFNLPLDVGIFRRISTEYSDDEIAAICMSQMTSMSNSPISIKSEDETVQYVPTGVVANILLSQLNGGTPKGANITTFFPAESELSDAKSSWECWYASGKEKGTVEFLANGE